MTEAAEPVCVAALFRGEMRGWGLRGDPFLWADMARRFESVPCPASPEAVRAIIEGAFAELTGHPVSHPNRVFVERYAHGGMSSGHVSPEFWRDRALPVLLARHAEMMGRKRGLTGQEPDPDRGES